jgi:hypothetical protein
MLGLPPNSTWMLQPLDLSVFGALKTFAAAFRLLAAKTNSLSKSNIVSVITAALILALSTSNIVAGFRAAGIWPWNPQEAIDRLNTKKKVSGKSDAKASVSLVKDAQKAMQEIVALCTPPGQSAHSHHTQIHTHIHTTHTQHRHTHAVASNPSPSSGALSVASPSQALSMSVSGAGSLTG